MSIMMPPDALAKLLVNAQWALLPLFDRTGWTRMAFGDFAQSIGERVERKDAADEEGKMEPAKGLEPSTC